MTAVPSARNKTPEMEWKDNPNYPSPVRERLKVVEEIALRNIAAINARRAARRVSLEQRLNAVKKSRDPVWVRLRALYAIADEEATYYGENVACRRGCAHCCHLSVGLMQP